MSTSVEILGASTVASKKQITAATIGSIMGWSLDLFDLFVLLYVAPVIGSLFFPSSNPALSLAYTYASFSVAC